MAEDEIDPIIEEIHQTRRRIAEKFDYDLSAIMKDAQERQEASGRPVWKGLAGDKSQSRETMDTNVGSVKMNIESDILNAVCADYPSDSVPEILSQLEAASSSARVQRCIVFAARGHPWYFDYLCRLAKIDYRDVIMAAEYDRLNIRLYDFNRSIHHARIDNPYATNTYGPDPTKL